MKDCDTVEPGRAPSDSHGQPLGRRWAIVLAGGDGERLKPSIREWFGEDRPKQYCAFIGTRSMLEHTWDRASEIVGPRQVVTVVAEHHKPWLRDSHPKILQGEVLRQPCNRGTAAAIYCALARILGRDPQATVLILPSDHFIHPEHALVNLARRSLAWVEPRPERLLLLGAVADRPAQELGWIETGTHCGDAGGGLIPTEVTGFREKPDAAAARALHESGALWSTMIVAAKGATLWEAGRECFPDLVDRMALIWRITACSLLESPNPEHLRLALSHAYRFAPTRDFSSDLLEKAARRCVTIPMRGIEWCDWGHAERLLETIARKGFPPAFDPNEARKRTAERRPRGGRSYAGWAP